MIELCWIEEPFSRVEIMLEPLALILERKEKSHGPCRCPMIISSRFFFKS